MKKKQPLHSLAACGLFTITAILLHLQCDFPLIDVNKGINNKCCECYSTLNTLLDSDECYSTLNTLYCIKNIYSAINE